MKLSIVPTSIDEANCYVEQFHRHRGRVVSAKFAIAVADAGGLVRGVSIVGRPVARLLDDGWTLEVTRVATDGTKNACSALYAASWRVSRELGYRKLVTYTLGEEPGTSLVASGFKTIARVPAKTWFTPSRPRVDRSPLQEKIRWEINA